MAKQIKMSEKTNGQLNDLSAKRKLDDEITKSKQSIVAELIDKAHKKEIKQ